jgi:hypothetical protein
MCSPASATLLANIVKVVTAATKDALRFQRTGIGAKSIDFIGFEPT